MLPLGVVLAALPTYGLMLAARSAGWLESRSRPGELLILLSFSLSVMAFNGPFWRKPDPPDPWPFKVAFGLGLLLGVTGTWAWCHG